MSQNNQDKYITNTVCNALTSKYMWSTMFSMRYTYKHFKELYPNDDACLDKIFQDRFGDLEFCPRCGALTKFYRVKKRQCYSCMHCGYQLHPLAGTIFRKSRTSLSDWFYAIYQFSTSKNGVAAKKLERDLGVTYKTAWRMCKQIRLLMQQEAIALTGVVETDETYIGGRHKGKSLTFQDKEAVFGMVERDGLVKAEHVATTGARVLLPRLRNSIAVGTTVYSDQAQVYRTLKRLGYIHESVNHSIGEYGRGLAHTNTIEGFWSQLKRSIDGTYHVVSPKYLQNYVNEFAFRYNYRGVAVCPILLELASKPV